MPVSMDTIDRHRPLPRSPPTGVYGNALHDTLCIRQRSSKQEQDFMIPLVAFIHGRGIFPFRVIFCELDKSLEHCSTLWDAMRVDLHNHKDVNMKLNVDNSLGKSGKCHRPMFCLIYTMYSVNVYCTYCTISSCQHR